MGLCHEQRVRLCGKTAIVTGATSGIGRSVCLSLAGAGVSVAVVGRDQARLADTVAALREAGSRGGDQARVIGMALDVRNEDDMKEMAAKALGHFGRIDMLVASAGILRSEDARPAMLVDTPSAEFDTVLATNLRGVFLANRAVLPAMIEKRSGTIVNVSSLSGRVALPMDGPYCASKFAVLGLTQSLAEEVRGYGIRVQSVLPGNTDTPIWRQNRLLPKAAHVVPVERVAEVIVTMLASPGDVVWPEVLVAPLAGRHTVYGH